MVKPQLNNLIKKKSKASIIIVPQVIISFIKLYLILSNKGSINSPTSKKIRNLTAPFSSFFKKFKRPKYLSILCILVSLFLSIVTYKNSTYNENNILYFLSSISQGLAAIFTLLFTITIFAIQMNRKYTLVYKIFDKWTLLLMILFSVGIILPFIQLTVNHNYLPFDRIENLSLAVDMFLASFCILSIIPYSIRINDILVFEIGLSNLSNEISEAIASDNKLVIKKNVKELIYMCNISLYDNKWARTRAVVDELTNIPDKISGSEWVKLNSSIIHELFKVSSKNQYKYTQITIIGIEALGTIGSKDKVLRLDKDKIKFELKGSYLSQVTDSFMISNYYCIMQNEPLSYILYILKQAILRKSTINKQQIEKAKFQTEFPIDINNFNKTLSFFYRFEFLHNAYEDAKKRNGFVVPEINLDQEIKTKIKDNLIVPEEFFSEKFLSLPQRTIMALYELGFKLSFESQRHILKIDKILNELEKIGVNAIGTSLRDNIVSMSSYCIYEITALSVQTGKEDENKDLLLKAMEHLLIIAHEAYKKDKIQFEDSYKSSLGFWWILGAYANKYIPNYISKMISELKNQIKKLLKRT